MSTAHNKNVALRYIEEVWNQGRLDTVTELLSPDCVLHERNGPDSHGVAGIKQSSNIFRSAFPDCHFTIEDTIAEADKVVLHLIIHATHTNPFFGVAPTGKEVTITGIEIFRFAAGKIVESWSNWDELGFRAQIGDYAESV